MSSTASIVTALRTTTSPMSAVFTPPSSCSSHWTYEAQSANSISGGLLLQDAQYDSPDPSCFPSGFGGWGRAPSFIQVFSPGACPAGYTTANNNFANEATTAVCCPSDFVYTTYLSSVNAGSKTAEYFGCTSMYNNAAMTTVFAEAGGFSSTLDGTITMVTTVSGPITMWAQPITVAFQEADLSLFTTPSSSTTSLSTESPTKTSSAESTSTASPTTTSKATTTTPLINSQSTFPSSSSRTSTTPAVIQNAGPGLTTGAIAGTAIGAAAVLAVIIGAAIYFRKKPKTTPIAARDVPTRHTCSDQDYWQQGVGSDKPRSNCPYHEPYYEFQRQKKPGELDGRQFGQFAELSPQDERRYELY